MSSKRFEIISLIHDKNSLLRAIRKYNPSVIFLDITLAEADGVDMIKEAANNTLLVLTGTCGDFAIKAYEYGAVDYLVKPITDSRIHITLERLQKFLRMGNDSNVALRTWLQIGTHEGTRSLHAKDILYLQAEGNYVKVVCRDFCGLLRKPLHMVKEELGVDTFWQIHRKLVVNCEAIDHVIKQGEGGWLALKNHQLKLRVSRKFITLFFKQTVVKKHDVIYNQKWLHRQSEAAPVESQ